MKVAKPLDPFGGEACLFLEFSDRRALDGRAGIVIADQSGR
jgi:hypothetical protein